MILKYKRYLKIVNIFFNVKRIFYRKGLERRWFDGHFHRRASACTAVGIVTTAKTIVVVMITPV